MAIDTENKRRAAQKQVSGLLRPVPDGSVSAADRAQSAWFYSGLSYTAPGTLSVKVNIGGVWKTGTVYVNIGGVWKVATAISVNVGGVWKSAA